MTSIINWLIFFLVNGLALFAAHTTAGYLVRDERALSLRVVASGLLYFAQITVTVLFLGVVVRYLTPLSALTTSVILSLVLIFIFRHYRRPLLPPLRSALCELFATRDGVLYTVVILFLIEAIVLLAKVIWLPPHIWDVFTYHLPPAVVWYQQGYIPAVIDTSVSRINGAPLGMTVLAFWFFSFFRNDMLVELPMLLWALLLVPVAYAVLRQSGVNRQWAIKFAIVVFFVPIVLMQATTVKDHLGLNISFLAGLLFLVDALQQRAPRSLLLAAVAFGLTLGYKIAAPIHVVIALGVFAALLYTRQRDWLTDAVQRRTLIRGTLISAVIMLVLGGYWYLRNLIVFGRLQGAYGTRYVAAGEFEARTGGAVSAAAHKLGNLHNVTGNLADLLPRLFDLHAPYYLPDLINISGFGPQFAAFGLVATLVAIVALFIRHLRDQSVYLIATAGLLLFLVHLFLNYNPNSYRLLSYLPMIMIVYAGVLLYRGGLLDHRPSRLIINSVLLACIVWNAALLFLPLPYSTNQLRLKEFVTLDASQRSAANYTGWFVIHRPSFYRELQYFSSSEPVAYLGKQGRNFPNESAADTWSYLYYDRNWQRRAIYMNQNKSISCNDHRICTVLPGFKQALQQRGVHLLSTCKVNHCLTLQDPEFYELMPGFYYYTAEQDDG